MEAPVRVPSVGQIDKGFLLIVIWSYPSVRDFIRGMRTCVNKGYCGNEPRTGRKTRKRYEYYISRQFQLPRTGGRSGEAGSQSRRRFDHITGLISGFALRNDSDKPRQKNLNGALNIGSHRGLRRYDVKYISPVSESFPPPSLSLSQSFWPFRK